jgi:hypothetical protein
MFDIPMDLKLLEKEILMSIMTWNDHTKEQAYEDNDLLGTTLRI